MEGKTYLICSMNPSEWLQPQSYTTHLFINFVPFQCLSVLTLTMKYLHEIGIWFYWVNRKCIKPYLNFRGKVIQRANIKKYKKWKVLLIAEQNYILQFFIKTLLAVNQCYIFFSTYFIAVCMFILSLYSFSTQFN